MTITDPNTYKLLTPGPLTTSLTVRSEMLVDRCTWDDDYKQMTQFVRRELLKLAHADDSAYSTVLMQGSGTFGVECVLSSAAGKDDCVLVPVNGAYSERMCQILERHGIAPAERERVFDPFYRILGNDAPGTGLGLAICRAIVDKAAGSIKLDWAEPSKQKGLLVVVELARSRTV